MSAIKAVERKLDHRVTAGDTIKVATLRALGSSRYITGLSVRPKLLCAETVTQILIGNSIIAAIYVGMFLSMAMAILLFRYLPGLWIPFLTEILKSLNSIN